MKHINILFDLDGTLTDSGPGIRNGVKHALYKFGIVENDTEKLNRFIGPPLYDSFIKFYDIPPEKAKFGEDYFREYYKDKGIFENSVYDGIYECLEKMVSSGLNLYIATSKPDFMAEKVISHFNLAKYFKKIYGADIESGLTKKKDVIALLLKNHPDITSENSLMVGDREHDVLGAKYHNIKSVGVLWGYGCEKEFSDSGACYIVKTPKELSDLITEKL